MNVPECRREGLTPVIDTDGKYLEFIVDCEIHGEIGRVPIGGDEARDGDAVFAVHWKTENK
jgi:hypothetical protein